MSKNDPQHFYRHLDERLDEARAQGLFKQERVLMSRQGPRVLCDDGVTRINLCANNYLGLSGSETLVQAGIQALKDYGFGLSSVRFICGTQGPHKALEKRLAEFLGTEDAILYAAAFDANGGVFEPLFDADDAIISDELNHASIIDGIRLCKANRYRYKHNDMDDLARQLAAADSHRFKLIVTDGVFSMDGTVAQLDKICALAEQHGALVMIDECHATGFMGDTGRGTHEHHHVMGRVDIITGTLGKALGGAMGGFTAGRRELIETLRQRSRPYLFSNSLAPAIVGTSLAVLDQLTQSSELRDRLHANTAFFRDAIQKLGFTIKPGMHPIVPVMLFEAPLAQRFAQRLYELGVLATGFFYPVVPLGQARVRVQMSAAHSRDDLTQALAAFEQAGSELGILN
ncbi:glycine C-acetyltransferase [Pandoraea thiooxydans]|uniref:2-amino-3-ketobutyrate coenzyme A ligase n=1 Tax=Pandoraea thiooxydans TaxID=445709 RepID=A0A0G3EPQ2_9BURK|nr:glycine C-acetyltransferase [Pandoraea thiooxydans]AKJ69048.1 glycine C-acetyltransferase [Pandoraea thiooxydans]